MPTTTQSSAMHKDEIKAGFNHSNKQLGAFSDEKLRWCPMLFPMLYLMFNGNTMQNRCYFDRKPTQNWLSILLGFICSQNATRKVNSLHYFTTGLYDFSWWWDCLEMNSIQKKLWKTTKSLITCSKILQVIQNICHTWLIKQLLEQNPQTKLSSLLLCFPKSSGNWTSFRFFLISWG